MEVYVFEDEENPEVPIVIHFPMINLSFKQFKAPGELFFFFHFQTFTITIILSLNN